MNKKKVGIVTIVDFDNYGNRLQNYAVSYLTNKYFESETLCIVEDNFRNKYNKFCYKFLWLEKVKIALRKVVEKDNVKKQRYYNFLLFSKNNISIRYCFKKNGVLKDDLDKKYEYFIVGSDQVWNPIFRHGSSFDFLTFASKNKRIAYAPSFGISEIPYEYQKNYKTWLEEMSSLSVREEAGAEIIKDLTNRDADVLIDPTLMLSKEKWLSISKESSSKPKRNYLLTYFLGEISYENSKRINNIAKENKLKIINLGDITDKETYIVGPDEFIDYINSASLLCTDSFHGCIFSILLEKPFIVFNRQDKMPSMNSRIDTLLLKFQLESRKAERIKDNNEMFEVDYSYVSRILDVERKKTIKYLENALNIEEVSKNEN